MNEILCPDCGHDLEIYETDIESHDEQLSLRCQGWCPNCKNAAKVYVWYETFQLISNTKPKQIR